MNKYLYISYDTFHNRNILRGFIRGEIRRYRICCSNDLDYAQALATFRQRLHNRGYPESFLHTAFNVKYDRHVLLNNTLPTNHDNNPPLIFKIPYTPRFTHTQLKQLLTIPPHLKDHPDIHDLFKGTTTTICYTRTPNIKEIIDKATQVHH